MINSHRGQACRPGLRKSNMMMESSTLKGCFDLHLLIFVHIWMWTLKTLLCYIVWRMWDILTDDWSSESKVFLFEASWWSESLLCRNSFPLICFLFFSCSDETPQTCHGRSHLRARHVSGAWSSFKIIRFVSFTVFFVILFAVCFWEELNFSSRTRKTHKKFKIRWQSCFLSLVSCSEATVHLQEIRKSDKH